MRKQKVRLSIVYGRDSRTLYQHCRSIPSRFSTVPEAAEFLAEEISLVIYRKSSATDSLPFSNRSYLKLTNMRMRSIASGILVGANLKKRQNQVLESSPTDSSAPLPCVSPVSSQKHPIPQRRDREVKVAQALSSDQPLDPIIGPTTDLRPLLEEQRRDIDHIIANENVLQQGMTSLRTLVENTRLQASHGFLGDINITADNITKVSSRLSELDVLKQDVKILQQRIKRLEESGSKDRLSTTLGLAHVSRQPSPTIEEYAESRHDASSNLSLFPATQALMSAHLDGLLTPQSTTFERYDVVNRGNSSFQGLPLEIKAKTLPPQKSFNSRSGTPINGTASKRSRTLTGMRPPQISRKGLERKTTTQRGSATGNRATDCTASTLITDVTKTTILPETKSTMQEASTGSYQNLEDPE